MNSKTEHLGGKSALSRVSICIHGVTGTKKVVFVIQKQHILSTQCTLRWNHLVALDACLEAVHVGAEKHFSVLELKNNGPV